MALEKVSEAGEGLKHLNPDGDQDTWAKTECPKELMMKAEQSEPWFKPKAGSVIPKEKRLVKTMMLEKIVQFCCVSDTTGPSYSAGDSKTHNNTSYVYPSPP